MGNDIDLKTLRRLSSVLYRARVPLLILGAPGSGKTSHVKAFAQEMGGGCHVESAAHCAPEDIGGLPALDSGRTRYRLPDWLPLVGDDSPETGILMFDDVADAPKVVLSSLYEIVCNRTIRGVPIKPGWWIVSACNRPEDLSAADPVSFAFANRGAVVTYVPSIEDTAQLAYELKWAAPLPQYYAWAAAARQPVETVNMEQVAAGNYAQPTNRSRSLLSQAIDAGAESRDYAMFVGQAEAVKILDYVTLLSTVPTPETIMAQPKTAQIPDKLGAQYAVAVGLATYVCEDLERTTHVEPYVKRLSRALETYYRVAVRDRTPAILSKPGWSDWAKKIDVAPRMS